ncbi:ATP-binding cassette domain-containing protein [Euzebya tangerina]|uniref:ATP-binding cassette domain-containing protein n=1 Tax=Euzebya tangerina TaxID=591198 RepID=UPI000E30B829|nr:ATP-binding cassette domain-containing protein [Euzebya tangerina]
MTPLLSAVSVERQFRVHGDPVTALRPISLEVQAGDFISLTGPSGSGKSTLCALLAGWDTPDGGRIDRAEGTTSVFTPQRAVLFDTLTVTENLGLAGPVDPALLDQLHIAELANRYPEDASLGERQRIAIARAVAAGADILILDEPTAHQDTETTQSVIVTLTSVATRGTAIVVATHDPALAEAATRTTTLNGP